MAGAGPATVSIHGTLGRVRAISTPIERATADHERDGPRYSRFANPTVDAVAERIAALEGADSAVLVASGSAAIACSLIASTPPRGTIVAAAEVCGDAAALLTEQLPLLGRFVRFVPVDDLEAWRAALAGGATTAYVETISNPGLRVADVPRISAIATETGSRLVVDATLSTPVNQQPLAQGADLVVHSAGKYLNGHGDLIAGTVAGGASTVAAVREVVQRLGACADPAAAFLLERGLKTLTLRMERHGASALLVARRLQAVTGVSDVRHPALPNHPDSAVAQRLLSGGSGVIRFTFDGGGPAAGRFGAALRLIGRAPTLGTAESLAWLPGIDRHASEPTASVTDRGMVRLSVGLEDPADIVADLDAALSPIASSANASAAR